MIALKFLFTHFTMSTQCDRQREPPREAPPVLSISERLHDISTRGGLRRPLSDDSSALQT